MRVSLLCDHLGPPWPHIRAPSGVASVPSPLPEVPPCLCASGFRSPTTNTALVDSCGISGDALA